MESQQHISQGSRAVTRMLNWMIKNCDIGWRGAVTEAVDVAKNTGCSCCQRMYKCLDIVGYEGRGSVPGVIKARMSDDMKTDISFMTVIATVAVNPEVCVCVCVCV